MLIHDSWKSEKKIVCASQCRWIVIIMCRVCNRLRCTYSGTLWPWLWTWYPAVRLLCFIFVVLFCFGFLSLFCCCCCCCCCLFCVVLLCFVLLCLVYFVDQQNIVLNLWPELTSTHVGLHLPRFFSYLFLIMFVYTFTWVLVFVEMPALDSLLWNYLNMLLSVWICSFCRSLA